MMHRLSSPAAMATFLCLSAMAFGQDNQPAPAGEKISLFNGKDLSGWVWGAGGKDTKIEDVWSVADGNLHCKGQPLGYIRTEKDYTSFILKLQVRHLKPGNGGILIRMVGQDKVWPKSVECQGQAGALGDIWNIDKFPMKVDAARTRDRQTVRMHPEVKERDLGEWNDYLIVMDGGHLTLTVNGTLQNEATDVQVVPGKICLQSEGSEYEFRNIELTPLAAGQRPREGAGHAQKEAHTDEDCGEYGADIEGPSSSSAEGSGRNLHAAHQAAGDEAAHLAAVCGTC